MFWSELFWPHRGGAEIFAGKLISAMQDYNYEFVVATRKDDPELPSEARHAGIEIRRYPFWRAFADRDIDELMTARNQVINLKRDFDPHLIHIHSFGPSVLFHLDTVKAHSAPSMITLTGNWLKNGVGRVLFARTIRSVEWITCVSEVLLGETRKSIPEIVPVSSVIHNAVDLPGVSSPSLDFDPPRLLYLGRLVFDKGVDVLFRAIGVTANRFPNLILTIAGDGPERPALERMVHDKGLSRFVEFVGWRPPEEVPDVLSRTSMVLMPSRREGLPLVALEAAAMGRPIIATRIGGLTEVVVNGETGLLVEPEDDRALSKAIEYLIEHPHVATRMGQKAHERVKKRFGWEQCIEAYDSLYQRLIRQNGVHDS